MSAPALTVLVVDDDAQILRALRTSLRARGYDVMTASNGETALELLSTHPPDLAIVDLGLPGIRGREVIERLRTWSEMPVIVLSVQDSHAEKVAALDAGADDYVTKPFSIDELLARIRAVQRRAAPERAGPILRFEGLEVDLHRRAVLLHGELVHLTRTEYRLLEAMATNPGKLLTHGWLLRRVWGPGYGTESHYVRVYVRQLRAKLADEPSRPRFIITEPGLGYRWKPEPDRIDE
ncbi:MAG TPA: response regulator transcription factor [Actinomycetota bacterium]|nr:response regulator transcription factor [Actinomycetota bacterium]